MKLVLVLSALCFLLHFNEAGKINDRSWADFVGKVKGFTLSKIKEIKKKLGESKWVQMQEFFLLNPHLPLMALSGQELGHEDIENYPSWYEKPENDDEVAEDAEEEEQCASEVCRITLGANSKDKDIVQICIHFATGYIGECASSNGAVPCQPSQLIACHPRPQLATALIDALLPTSADQPLIFFPIFAFNDTGKLPRLMTLEQTTKEVSNHWQKIFEEGNFAMADVTKAILQKLRDISKNVAFVVDDSLEGLQKFVEEQFRNKNETDVIGIVTHHNEEEGLSQSQKAEVIKIVNEVVKGAYDQTKAGAYKRSEGQKESLAKSLQNYLTTRSFDIIEEIPGYENAQVFRFSRELQDQLDRIVEGQPRNRMTRRMDFLGDLIEMKTQALVSIKEAVADFFEEATKKADEEKELEIITGSSSWPWHPSQMSKRSCVCLETHELLKDLSEIQEPCSQPIPWCFVDPDSGCSDSQSLHKAFNSGLYWSQEACTNYKTTFFRRPYYF